MNALSRSLVLLSTVIVLTALVPIFGCPTGGQGQGNLEGRVQSLEGQVASLNAALAAVEAKLTHVSVDQGTINGVNGPHLIIEGCNVHVRDGIGTTDDDVSALNGLGNLIVGYNPLPNTQDFDRKGSHNVVIGDDHEYPNYGGLVAGTNNDVTGVSASITGGSINIASGNRSSVNGGTLNTASGGASSVNGGDSNSATASHTAVNGGQANVASNFLATVNGGQRNEASGSFSTVSGGSDRTATNTDDWVAGSLFEDD
jgi:hypothetical protein